MGAKEHNDLPQFDMAYWDEYLFDFLEEFEDPVADLTRGPKASPGDKTAARGGVKFEYVGGEHGYVSLSGLVADKKNRWYETTLYLGEEGIDAGCACTAMYECEHSHAAALTLLAELYRRGLVDAERAISLLPDNWLRGDWSDLEWSRPVFDRLLGPYTESAAPAPEATEPQEDWWRAFLHASTAQERWNLLQRTVAEIVGIRYAAWYAHQYLRTPLEQENLVRALRAFLKFLPDLRNAKILGSTQSKAERDVDRRLRVWLESDEATALERQLDRMKAQGRLIEWLQQTQAQSPPQGDRAHVEVLWTDVPSERDGALPLLCFELLLTSKKLQRSPRNMSGIENLKREIANGKRQVSAAEAKLVEWLTANDHTHAPVSSSPSDSAPTPILNATRFEVRAAVEWLALWGDTGLLRWDDGGAVVLHGKRARLGLLEGPDGRPQWAVEFPDGEEAVPLSEARLMADLESSRYSPSAYQIQRTANQVYVRRGDGLWRLETGGMPHQVLAALTIDPEVPVDRLRETGTGRTLVRRLALSARTGLVEEVPVSVTVECRSVSSSTLTFSARAHGPHGQQWYRAHDGEWVPRDSKERPKPNDGDELDVVKTAEDGTQDAEDVSARAEACTEAALATVPRAADVAPVNEWFASFPNTASGVSADDGYPALEWRLRPAQMLDFFRLWSERPRKVTFVGNRAFRELVTIGRVPRIRINVEPSGADWLQVSLEMEKEIEALPIADIISALDAQKQDLVLLTGGRVFRRDDLEGYRNVMEALSEAGLEAVPGPQRVHAIQLAQASGDTLTELAAANAQLERLAVRTRELARSFRGVPPAPIPAEVAETLRPYQRTGADFLAWSAQTFGGAILADDMGLGKTLQWLAALSALRTVKGNGGLPSLVVCPASVAHNWKREAERFAPHLRVVVLESGAGRRKVLQHLTDYDLVIKNYALARRDIDTLRDQEWLAVCVDEAQAIKNPAADITRAVKSLNARYRFALTGTPIENRLTDLWSIVDYVSPGYLHTLNRFEQRLKTEDPHLMHRVVRARLRPILMRRMKREVAPELPPRIEERRDCQMVPSQRKAYLAEVQKTRLLLQGMGDGNGREVGQARIRMLAALTRLRQICCDPVLVGLPDRGSGKVNELFDLLGPILESGHKVLLFSQFVKMLKRLEIWLGATGIKTYILTGDTKNRQDLVDAFEADATPSVFLISLKAGGTGLNLPSASHVILFDPWWNPAVEAQAIDRTHRIGQDKTVLAFRLVAAGTIEERIIELQERKRGIVSEVLEEEAFNRSLTQEDLEFILSGAD